MLNDTNQCPFDYQQIFFVKYISVMGHIEVTELELMRSGGGGIEEQNNTIAQRQGATILFILMKSVIRENTRIFVL